MAHLQTPIPHMDVADNVMALNAIKPFYRFANNSRPQVTHMHRLSDIGPAIINDDREWLYLLNTKIIISGQLFGARRDSVCTRIDIDKTWSANIHFFNQRMRPKRFNGLTRNVARINFFTAFFGNARRAHSAVALKRGIAAHAFLNASNLLWITHSYKGFAACRVKCL